MKLEKNWQNRKLGGFSLVELMVVVAIIGILAALALPRFRTFQAKARQAEAKNNLVTIYTLQEAYRADHDAYFSLQQVGGNSTNCSDDKQKNQLGFVLNPCDKSRYTYWVELNGGGYVAHAKSGDGDKNNILPGCAADEWTIDQNKNLVAVNDSTITCSK